MSTLKVNTIQDASGSNSSTPAEISNGRAKAWGNLAGTGTPALRDSYNCSSITDNGDGDYTINFTTDFSDDDYSFIATAENWEGNNNDSYCGVSPYYGSFATGSIRIRVVRWRWDNYYFRDSPNVCFAVFR
tara:strand:+ start:2240 stop:2632 length:393 start_codon:yes stop_codon:yes gene_type:complete